MDTLKDTTLYDSCKFGILSVGNDVYILRADHNIYRSIITKALIDALELMTDKLNLAVTDHCAIQDITLADKVGYKGVYRLIIDINRCANLLNLTVAHNHNGI